MTVYDLQEILGECAGEYDRVDHGDAFLDTLFAELGYDSLALLETAAQVERRFGVRLGDDVVAELKTPREFMDTVNGSARLAS